MSATASSPVAKRKSAVSRRLMGGRYFGSPAKPVLNQGDLRAMRFAFAFAAGLVIAAAIGADSFLLASIWRAPSSFDDASVRQLATDLLPWALAFTAVAGASTWIGLTMFRGIAGETTVQPASPGRLISHSRMRINAFSPG